MSKTLTHSGSLIDRGLAERDESGRLHATDRAYGELDKLQIAFRERKRLNPENRGTLNQRWSGQILADLADLAVDYLLSGKRPAGENAVRDLWGTLNERGHDVTLSQLRYGLAILKDGKTPEAIWQAANSHRSYGDWWRSLTGEQRGEIIEKRKAAHFHYLKSLSTDARASVRNQIGETLAQCAERASPSETGQRERQVVLRALERDKALKSLEEGQALATGTNYQGVPEPMRSSWEALYARAVMQKQSRFYIYEPMGFPLVDPKTGRIEAYHPDFLECTNTPTGTHSKIVEIKGYLTETGQRKIALFQQYYLQGDFSGVPPGRVALLKELVEKAKSECQRQFGVELGPDTKFRVYGELPWNHQSNNFDLELHGGRGFITRLRARCPHLCPEGSPPQLSNTERSKIAKRISGGDDNGKLVEPGRPHGARIGRSAEVVINSHVAATAFMHLVGLNEELSAPGGTPISDTIRRNAVILAGNAAQALLVKDGSSSRQNSEMLSDMKAMAATFDGHAPGRSNHGAFAHALSLTILQGFLQIIEGHQYGPESTVPFLAPETELERRAVRGIFKRISPHAASLREELSEAFISRLDSFPDSAQSELLAGREFASAAIRRYFNHMQGATVPMIEQRYGFDGSHTLNQTRNGYESVLTLEISPGKHLIPPALFAGR